MGPIWYISKEYIKALIFPSLEGLDYIEEKLFFYEHYMGTIIGPMILIIYGRYGFMEGKKFFLQQIFGFSTHVLY
jgi:hypothetical protein